MNKKDYLNQQPKKLYKVSQLLEQGQIDLDDLANIIPGVLHINSLKDLGMQFLSKTGQDIIQYSLEEVQTLGAEIFQRHQNEKTFTEVYPKLIAKLN
ncbi:MAG: hypothetical protein AAGH46_12435 [Bacteroidota bacterium]